MATTLKELLEEVLVVSGNAFLGDLDAVGFEQSQFLVLVKRSMRKFLEYRNILATIQIPYDGSTYINLNTIMDPVPKYISKVMADNQIVAYNYNDAGILMLHSILPSSLITIQFVNRNGVGLITKIDPTGPEQIDNLEVFIDDQNTRYSEFVDLVVANFKIALGGAVRRFRIEEMPIGLDGDSLLSEGRQELDEVIRQLQETSDAYDNMRASPEYKLDSRSLMYASLRISQS